MKPETNPISDTSTTPIVRTHALCKRFGERTAVDTLELAVPRGVCYGLLGPNGAGKTTTLRMVYGVTKPTSGSIEVFGLDIAENCRAVRARVGVTLQDNVLVEALTPEENLSIFGRYHLLREPELSARVDEMIDFLSLGSHRDVPVRNLSGGFQRRLAIALSLMNRPELLILDEPTTGLDPAVRLALWSRIRDLRSRGTTVLLTTHYMDEAERLCDRVGIVANGRLIAEGTPQDLIRNTLAPETVEVVCTRDEETSLLDGLHVPPFRLRTGDRVFFHMKDSAEFAHGIRTRDGGEHRVMIVRPTTLEDVFLSLTGTSLEAGE